MCVYTYFTDCTNNDLMDSIYFGLKIPTYQLSSANGCKGTGSDNSKQLKPVNEDQKKELSHVTNSGCC